MKKNLLWIGDACVATGFARSTHYICTALGEKYNVVVLGLNYMGDPHGFRFPIYPCRTLTAMNDWLGVKRVAELCTSLSIDLIVIQNDVWNIPSYIEELRKKNLEHIPVVAFLAVDGENCQSKDLDGVSLAIFWTEFGLNEADKGGWKGKSAVVPLGVDLNIYKLEDMQYAQQLRDHARSLFAQEGFPTIDIEAVKKGFIVGCVNRNQQRKRFDLLTRYFCKWIDTFKVEDAFLFVHACPTGEQEYDIEQLMSYYGHKDRLILVYPDLGTGIPEAQLPWTYRCMDVLASTTQGEGFGLTTLEAMALGIPVIAPEWSALGEICKDAAVLVPCTSTAATQKRINCIGGIPDEKNFIRQLQRVYQSKALRTEIATLGYERARESRFRWENVAKAFSNAIDDALLFPESKEEFFKDMVQQ